MQLSLNVLHLKSCEIQSNRCAQANLSALCCSDVLSSCWDPTWFTITSKNTTTLLKMLFTSSIHEVKNYRPVTLLPACDKVFEKLLSQQVTAFIEPRLSRNLTAYRKRHSTETSLIKLTENWKRAIDDRNIVGILSTDMSKAFDSLHPPLLLRKLDAYGFSTSSTGLLRSYFTERKYRVKIGTEITSLNGRRC